MPLTSPFPPFALNSETFMLSEATEEEGPGLFTVRSSLYMLPTTTEKGSAFHCMAEYSRPGEEVQKKKSNAMTVALHCE